MIRNYLLISLRGLRKNRTFSFLNILGLSIGMAACLLILQYVSFERSYDQFHSKRDRIYRVDMQTFQKGEYKGRAPWSGYQFGPTILDLAPGVETFVRTHQYYGGCIVTYEGLSEVQRQYFEEDVALMFADQSFLDVFDFDVRSGNPATMLTEPNTIVLTEAMVQKYLPQASDPVGETIRLDGNWAPGSYKVTGVLENTPGNSHLSFDFLISSKGLIENAQYADDDGWGWLNFVTYVLLEEKTSIGQVTDVTRDIYNDRNRERFESANINTEVAYTPLDDIHLRDKVDSASGVSEQTLFFFVIIAAFIIAIAWLNYINLATAQAMKRAKEVGIRKVVGARKRQLVAQFLMEALLLNLLALSVAFGLAILALPVLGDVLERQLLFGQGIPVSSWISFGFIFFAGTLLSGFYPSMVLSNFRPSVVIKGVGRTAGKRFGLRQVLVVVQLVIGVFLISGTMTVYRQLQFMRTRDLGMNVDRVVAIRGPQIVDDQEDFESKMRTFLDEMKSQASINAVSSSDAIPGGDYNWSTNMVREGQDEAERQPVKVMWVDDNFLNTYEMDLIAGRFHDDNIQGDENLVVVNETLIEKFNFSSAESALNQKLQVGTNDFRIIGVLKDYHWYAPRQPKEAILLNYTRYGSNISLRMVSQDAQSAMAIVEAAFQKIFPGNPFQYYFMDDFFDRQYKEDQRFGLIFSAFSVVAIVIACLGLFGLASFTLSLRVKEIGIRKVLGASVQSILRLIFKDYLRLVLIAGVLALPAVYYAINQWLQTFASHISITADLLLLPVLLLLLVAMMSISFRSLQSAMSNPVNSLKDE